MNSLCNRDSSFWEGVHGGVKGTQAGAPGRLRSPPRRRQTAARKASGTRTRESPEVNHIRQQLIKVKLDTNNEPL